jgi:regulator of sigma E protease
MEIVIKIAQLILSLSILVIIHELGHFIFAKIFKTRVEKFYLFFDPWFSIFKYKKGETEYGVGWLPLGGYVKIAGMIDESMDREQMKLPPKPDEFRSKKAWQRLLIMVGGVLFNLILAIFIYAGILFTWGEEYLPMENMKYGIVCDSLATEIGLKNGDKIITIDNQKVEKATGISAYILLNGSKTIQVSRDGNPVEIQIPESIIPKLINGASFVNPRIPFFIGEFAKESAGKAAGMQIGDRIIAIDSVETPYFDQFKDAITGFKNKTIIIKILRKTDTIPFSVSIPETAMVGVAASFDSIFDLRKTEYGFFASFPAGITKAVQVGHDYLKQFKLLANPKTEAYKSVGGFGSIAKIFPSEWDWLAFWSLTGFLSIMLAILNILPIPALDGGHVMFVLYEMVTRRKPSDKFLEYAQMVGLFLLLALLVFANGNDILKWIQGRF